MAEELPQAVLFACNLNCVRSPMAAGLLRRRFASQIFVDSCGLKPGDQVDPFAVAVMDELGVDIETHRPKGFDDLEDGSFDLVVSLTPQAQHRAVELTRASATDLEFWPMLDPTMAEGSRDARLDAYRQVRDELDLRIALRFGRDPSFGG